MVSHVWSTLTKWNLLQLPSIPVWVGTGVDTPFPGSVVVAEVVKLVVADVGEVVVDGTAVVVLRAVVVLWAVVVLGGPGSKDTSMQYDRPAGSVPQSAGTEGFYRVNTCS
jgi:hypothetical protein